MSKFPNNASECKHRWNAVFCLVHFSVSQRWYSFKWFSYFNWRTWGYFMSEVKYRNIKIGCITCKWTSKKPEKIIQWFSYKFLVCICSRKSDSVNGMPENVASRRILTKMAASVFHRIWRNIKKCKYKSPIYGYLPHKVADWKHPSIM